MTTTSTGNGVGDPPRKDGRVRRNVLFLGTHGQANVGDELLLDTFLTELGPDNHYSVNSYDPAATSEQLADRFDVAVFDTATDRIGLLRNLWESDVVVFGGGNILKELYRSVGRWRYSTLVMVLGVVVLARLLAKPVLMANIGTGPVESRPGRLLVRAIISLVWLVSVRDEGSYSFCRSIGCPERKVRLVPDAVWARSAGSLGTLESHQLSGGDGGALRVALNLNKDVDAAEEWSGFLDRLAEGLGILAQSQRVEFHALPMQCGFKEGNDLEVLEDLLGRLDAPVRIHAPADHQEVAAIVSGCDVVVSERLHAIILAAMVGTPIVGLCYDVKVRELTAQLGIEGRSFDVSADLDPESLARAVVDAAADSAQESRRLAQIAARRRADGEANFEVVRSWVAHPQRSWERLAA